MARLLAPILALILGLALLIVVCRPPRDARGGARSDFTFINSGDPSTLDPQRMSWARDLRFARIIFEGLVRNDMFGERNVIKPAVAERWEISPDQRTYTFHLRADAKWSSGDPVRASDFVYTWRRALLPDIASDYTAHFQVIQGAREFYKWRQQKLDEFKQGDDASKLWIETQKKFDEMVGLKAPDDRTLIVTLDHPVPYFLDFCAFASFFPVYPPLVSQYDTPDPATGRLTKRSGWTRAESIVCNGPFKLDSWRFKRDMHFSRNPHYWDPNRINFDRMTCLVIEDSSAQIMAFRSHQVDFISDVFATYRPDLLEDQQAFIRDHQKQYDDLKSQGHDQVTIERLLPTDSKGRDALHSFDIFGIYFYSFNCSKKLPDGRDNPFADPRVRRAFAMAMDKPRISLQVRRLGERSVGSLIPPNSIPGYTSPAGLPHDVQAARDLLAEAGFPGGKGLPTIQILYTRDSGQEFIAQSVKKDWEEALGASVELVQHEIKVFRHDLHSGNFMVARGSWFGDYGDPTTFLDINRTDDGNNDRKYSSKAFDDLMAASDLETDQAKRMALLQQAEQIIVEQDLPIIPIFQYVQLYMYDPHRLTGITSDPRQEQEIQEMDLLGDHKGADVPKERPATKSGSNTESHGQPRSGAQSSAFGLKPNFPSVFSPWPPVALRVSNAFRGSA
jgi:oligopeptide transport system substrate-binding protein